MKLRKKTTSEIGIDGVSLVEVLITLVILSTGLVGIFKTFIISLDRLNYMTNRLYAIQLVDNRISEIERALKIFNTLAHDLNYKDQIDVGAKSIHFEQALDFKEIEGLADLYAVDLSMSWKEGPYQRQVSQSAYITNFGLNDDEEQ